MLRSVRSRRTAWLAERLDRLRPKELAAIEAALEPLSRLLEERSEARAAQRAHLRQPPPPPQLPPLLRRPDRLAERHVDAEHRARLARRRADALAGRGRPPRIRAASSPFSIFSLPAGVLADRLDNRRVDDAHAGVSMVVSAVLAASRSRGQTRRSGRSTSSPCSAGTAPVFDAPNRHALTFQLVGRDELPNAVALNASLFNASRVIGPAIGGVVIAAAGVGACFALNAVSFLAVLAALALMRTRELFPLARKERPELIKGMRQGLGYVRRTPADPARPAHDDGRLDRRVQLPRARAGARVQDAARRRGGLRCARRGVRARRARRRAARRDVRQGELEGARPRLGRVQHDAARARAQSSVLARSPCSSSSPASSSRPGRRTASRSSS